MAWRFSWCTVVTVLVLLFVAAETQAEDHQKYGTANRGSLRFKSKSLEETSPASISPAARPRSSRDRSLNTERHNVITTPKPSSSDTDTFSHPRTISIPKEQEETGGSDGSSRRNSKGYLAGSSGKRKSRGDVSTTAFPEIAKDNFRRASNRKLSNLGITNKLDNKGPSVFTATTGYTRSRTGRKIQTTYSTRNLKTQIPTSRKYNNKKPEDVEVTTVPFRRIEGSRSKSTTEMSERGSRTGRLKANHRENNSISRRGQDTVLSESESVRVDIPLTVRGTESPVTETTAPFNGFSRKQDIDGRSDSRERARSGTRTGFERAQSRGRSIEPESTTVSLRSNSRRGSSRFSDSSTTEASEESVSWRSNTLSRDRSRNSEAKKNSLTESRSRSRNRNFEHSPKATSTSPLEQDGGRESARERNSPEKKSRVLDPTTKPLGNRMEQDRRARSRNRSRLDPTTTAAPLVDVATTIAPDSIVWNVSDDVTTSTESETMTTTTKSSVLSTTAANSRTATTPRPSSTSTLASASASEGTGRGRGRGRGRGGGNQGRKQLKEDFFNHGLGFRGRKIPSENSSSVADAKKSKNDTKYQGNPGWTLRRRPAHSNFAESPRTVVSSPTDQTNEVIPSSEQVTTTEVISTVETLTSSTRRTFSKQQTAEEASAGGETTTAGSRRGNKTYDKSKTFGSVKSSTEPDENDNYPPDFKARLSQLKNTNTKISASKTTARPTLEDQPTNIFGQRSRSDSKAFEPGDLETAASGNVFLTDESFIMNPLTLINGAGVRRVKKSSVGLFAERSRMKLELARRLVKPELNIEENDLDATTTSSFSKPKTTDAPVVAETSKVVKFAKDVAVEQRSSIEKSHSDENNWKLSRLRKGLEDSSKGTGRLFKKGRIVSERMVTSISVEERNAVEDSTKPYASTISSGSSVLREDKFGAPTDSPRKRRLGLRGGKTSKEEEAIANNARTSVHSNRQIFKSDSITTIKPSKSYIQQLRNKAQQRHTTDLNLNPTTISDTSYTTKQKSTAGQEKFQEPNTIKKAKASNTLVKSTFRPRYSKTVKQKSNEETGDYQTTPATLTTKLPVATSRYSKKKSAVKSFDSKTKVRSTEGAVTETRKQEFRPRTSTYRRHSDIPTTQVESSTRVNRAGVAITPKSPRYHATLKSSTSSPRSVSQAPQAPQTPQTLQAPQVNLQIANDTVQQALGIVGSSNGDSGTNVFNPTRSVFVTGNSTLLEQLRSTVAPLLTSLGNKTPVFSGAYSNVNSANSGQRILPNGSPPRYSARYKGAELFVRKQNTIYQPTVPSITSSSTTSATPVENSGSAPLIDVSSPGEPKILTFYHALESASVRNEQLQGNSRSQEQSGRALQVDSSAPAANGINNNSNNDTISSRVATVSLQIPDIVANTSQDRTQNSAPAVTGVPENFSTTEQAFTSTEPPSTTEQASASTQSLSTTEQTTTNADSMSISLQSNTPSESADTTMSAGGSQNAQILSRLADTPNSIAETTTVPMNQDVTSSLAPSTTAVTDDPATTTVDTNNIQSTDSSLTTSTQNPQTSTQSETITGNTDLSLTTPASQSSTESTTNPTAASDTPNTSTSENPESNTIPLSETTIIQAADIPTTKLVSDNMIETEMTTTPAIRNRLIDFAQDILSHLQLIGTSTVPSQDSATTVSPVGLKETETTQEELGTTILPTGAMDQSGLTDAEMTTQSAVGSVTTSLFTAMTDRSNETVTTQQANTRDDSNTTPTTAMFTQTSQTDSNTLNSTRDMEVTTISINTSTDDTLLTELMSIAKTLLSEEMNETEQFLPLSNFNNTSRIGNLMENEVDQPNLSDETLGTTQTIESSSILPTTTTEAVDSPPTEFSKLLIDPSLNEVDSPESTTIGLSLDNSSDIPRTTPRNTVIDNEMITVQTTQATSLRSSTENVESSTSSLTSESEPRAILSSRISSNSANSSDTITQQQTTTQSSQTTVTPNVNFELTTNTYDLVSSNLVTTTETQPASGEITEFIEIATTTVTSLPMGGTSVSQPEITTMSTVPESTLSSVNTVTAMPSTPSGSNVEQTTVMPTVEFVENGTSVVDNMTNQTAKYVSQLAPMSTEIIDNEILEATPAISTTTAPQDVNSMDVTTNQFSLTSTAESPLEITTNTPSETTITPQITPNLENETATVIARLQDATPANAQGTAGSLDRIAQVTETTTPIITDSSTVPSSSSSSSVIPSVMTTASFLAETTTPTITTMTTETTTSTPQTTVVSARGNAVSVTAISETEVPTPVTTVDVSENLVSTSRVSSENVTTMNAGVNALMNATSAAAATPTRMNETTSGMGTQPMSVSILGRFGDTRLTPAPMFSQSSTTRAPLRDYLVYGIYPNKTIVRKRPEDNLIDARNVDSPYVIFGIFPDGKLVRKFPNGTIIPDPPRNPVEVVFSLSTTTTTNRPPLRPYYNQANQDTYNQVPVYSNNRRPDAEQMRNVESPSTVDLGLTGNSIVGPNGGGPDNTGPLGTPASAPSTAKMSDVLVNTQMGTTLSAMSAIAGPVTPMVSTGRPPTDSQGGRIVQDRERDEATRTKEAGGQRSSVYIGQDKFVNYWTDGVSLAPPRVASVKINSVATSVNEGPSSSIASFENLLNSQPGGQITAPPGFPWRDPLDKIFGITTSSPMITASVASNRLDDSAETNSPEIVPRPINPFVEVFTPYSSSIGIAQRAEALFTTTTSTSTTMMSTTTTASTPAQTEIAATSTTMTPTTTTMAPSTTTTTTSTVAPTTITTITMPAPTTMLEAGRTASIAAETTTTAATSTASPNPATILFNVPNDIATMQQQDSFGRTFDDLVFLNSLLQGNSRSTMPKTLTQVEQMLAHKILSLALNNNAGPPRSPKAINIENVAPNSIIQSTAKPFSFEPIVIDLSPSSTAAIPTWKQPVETTQSPVKITLSPEQVTWTPVSTSGTNKGESKVVTTTTAKTIATSTKKPAVTTTRPKATSTRSFGSALWEALFGNGIFGPSTTPKPVKAKQAKTTQKFVSITPKPIQTKQTPQTTKATTTTTTMRTVDISKIQVNTPNSYINEERSSSTSKPISPTKQPLLNSQKSGLPNAETSTSLSEEDAQFLLSLLRAFQQDNKAGVSKKTSALTKDDELFLRTILSGQVHTTTTPAPSREISDVALLAALLKAQGIEPPALSTNIREQLQSANLDRSVSSVPTASPTTESTTRPTSIATRPTDSTKKTVTPRPTSRPRIRTTTWSPSSTYPPPLFNSFSNYGTSVRSSGGNNSENSALFGATRAFSQFLGAAISGAAQQLQSLVRNGTRIVSEVVG